MSYTPHTWESGETVTAEKLNAMETGIAGGGISSLLIADIVYDERTDASHLNKTAAEIKNALDSGKLLIVRYESVIEPGFCSYDQFIPTSIQCGDDENPWINIDTAYTGPNGPQFSFETPSGDISDMNFYPVMVG